MKGVTESRFALHELISGGSEGVPESANDIAALAEKLSSPFPQGFLWGFCTHDEPFSQGLPGAFFSTKGEKSRGILGHGQCGSPECSFGKVSRQSTDSQTGPHWHFCGQVSDLARATTARLAGEWLRHILRSKDEAGTRVSTSSLWWYPCIHQRLDV
jgi:hypothetical protein